MSKTTDIAKVSTRGGFHVFWGVTLSTLISSVGTIFINNLLGPDNVGLYTIAIGAPALFATFRDWGLNTAMIRYTAQYNSENNIAKVRSIFIAGLIFELALGLALSIISIALAGPLATAYNRPEIVQLIQIASIFILSSAMITTASAAFTGMEKLHLNSIMLIIQAIAKTGLIIALVFFGLGTLGATVGFTAATLVAGITGVLLMYTLYSSLHKPPNSKLAIGGTIKALLKYGLPISIGAILTGFLTMFYNFIMPIFVTDNSAIGNYATALQFVVLISFFATPVITMVFPAFSKLDYRQNPQDLKNIFQYSVKYATLIVVPVTVLVMSLAEPAINTVYRGFLQAPFYLMLLSISYLFTALGSLSLNHLIISQGDTKYTLKLAILQAAIGFPLSFVLVSQFGIIGLIANTTIVVLPGLFLSLGFIKKRYGASIDWKASAKITFSAAVTGILTYLLVTWLPFISPIRLAIGVVVFVVVFVLIACLTQTITRADLGNIQTSAEGLGPLRKPIQGIIGIIEKLMPKP
ncbi:MAG: oligosaccharide flippase family protein [Nitrososphaerota archaeon]|jgi:O-antigen/teichoic acid export membrane protein|nr:oligosaccharide flippase family protein [Nitrososphaerota archaeon]